MKFIECELKYGDSKRIKEALLKQTRYKGNVTVEKEIANLIQSNLKNGFAAKTSFN